MTFNEEEYAEVIYNLMSGIHIDDLSDNEILLLQHKHGENYKKELGY